MDINHHFDDHVKSEVTILLVEDDDVDAMALYRSFRTEKIANTIVRAHDGIEALELLKSGRIPPPYIILLDLQLPRMNGFEFLDEIRNDPILHTSVVFVLTSSKHENDLLTSYRQHVAGYFIKDETGAHFVEVVKMLDGYWRLAHFPE